MVAEVAVAAVVFGPERARHASSRRTALVLGAGGVLGAAWMTGALACLADRLPCAAGDVDLIVGTSAGSVLAAALRCRARVRPCSRRTGYLRGWPPAPGCRTAAASTWRCAPWSPGCSGGLFWTG